MKEAAPPSLGVEEEDQRHCGRRACCEVCTPSLLRGLAATPPLSVAHRRPHVLPPQAQPDGEAVEVQSSADVKRPRVPKPSRPPPAGSSRALGQDQRGTKWIKRGAK